MAENSPNVDQGIDQTKVTTLPTSTWTARLGSVFRFSPQNESSSRPSTALPSSENDNESSRNADQDQGQASDESEEIVDESFVTYLIPALPAGNATPPPLSMHAECTFSLQTPSRLLLLAASSSSERHQWMAVLSQHLFPSPISTTQEYLHWGFDLRRFRLIGSSVLPNPLLSPLSAPLSDGAVTCMRGRCLFALGGWSGRVDAELVVDCEVRHR